MKILEDRYGIRHIALTSGTSLCEGRHHTNRKEGVPTCLECIAGAALPQEELAWKRMFDSLRRRGRR